MPKFDVAFYVPGLPFNGDDLHKKSLGGSETAGLCVAREMRARGHSVHMFCNTTAPDVYDGVAYHPAEQYIHFATSTPHDVSIVQRMPQVFSNRLSSKVNLLWCHDLALGRQREQVRGVSWNIDRFCVVSDWMQAQYAKVYGIEDRHFAVTRNGIDLDLIPETREGDKNHKRLVYSARPERGLDILLDKIMPRLLALDPDIELMICGYDNPVEHLKPFYAAIAEKCEALGERVKHGGHLSKPALYDVYSHAGVYVYPTPSPIMKPFREVSCISAMEAQACGLPIVTSNRGALSETIHPDAGVLIDGDPTSDEYVERFIDATMTYINDRRASASAAIAGRQNAQSLTWAERAEDWENLIADVFEQTNDDPLRLAHHFYRHSDIGFARKALARTNTRAAQRLKRKIDREYTFANSDAALAAHYYKNGLETDRRLSERPDPKELFEQSGEPRYHRLLSILWSETNADDTILDYGCGHGWFDIFAANKIGRKWLGVDIDPNAVKWTLNYASKYAREPGAISCVNADYKTLSLDDPADCLVVSEVLEHMRDPVGAIESLEAQVKPGGLVVVTVPYGPAEFTTANWVTFRNHLHWFEPHDLEDLFGNKPGFHLEAVHVGALEQTGEPVGSLFVTYRADHEPLGKIDEARKLRQQRPRQTVSASLIAGGPNSSETLHWCLNSLRWIADEIVIADCGMSDEAKRIAKQHDVRIVRGVNPLEHGFEAARNASLKACSMDWVFWLDTDERVVNGAEITKYARENLYDGYGIRQHHFTVDAGFKPDMPVRLFRRRPVKGRWIKFYGMIHEHPERVMNKGPGDVIVIADVHIAHVGYLHEPIRRARFSRNHPLLLRDAEKYPKRRLGKHFLMRDNNLLCMYDQQANGGAITPLMQNLARENVKLYREYFLGKPAYINVDSLQYYTAALQILGEGIDVQFDVAAQRDGIGDDINGHGTIARFANAKEAEAELTWRIRDKTSRFDSEYW